MRKIVVFILLILTVSCNETKRNTEVEKEISLTRIHAVEVHDKLMKKMGELNSMRKKLQLIVMDSTAIGSYDEISLAINELLKADKSMWDWMHNFDVTYAHENDSLTLGYYKNKLKEINDVELLFDSSMAGASKLK